MARYRIKVIEHRVYEAEYEIEAESAEEASEKAEDYEFALEGPESLLETTGFDIKEGPELIEEE